MAYINHSAHILSAMVLSHVLSSLKERLENIAGPCPRGNGNDFATLQCSLCHRPQWLLSCHTQWIPFYSHLTLSLVDFPNNRSQSSLLKCSPLWDHFPGFLSYFDCFCLFLLYPSFKWLGWAWRGCYHELVHSLSLTLQSPWKLACVELHWQFFKIIL